MFLVLFLWVVASFQWGYFRRFLQHTPVVKHVLLFCFHLDVPICLYSSPLIPCDLVDLIKILFLLFEVALSTLVMFMDLLSKFIPVC